mmetsp:Transcript_94127/g.304553  ORF Transcript_94127/g.304553 Transcript_94127/m.304553 type:complete len:220 (+) Transcript_94127:1182-1841(+)
MKKGLSLQNSTKAVGALMMSWPWGPRSRIGCTETSSWEEEENFGTSGTTWAHKTSNGKDSNVVKCMKRVLSLFLKVYNSHMGVLLSLNVSAFVIFKLVAYVIPPDRKPPPVPTLGMLRRAWLRTRTSPEHVESQAAVVKLGVGSKSGFFGMQSDSKMKPAGATIFICRFAPDKSEANASVTRTTFVSEGKLVTRDFKKVLPACKKVPRSSKPGQFPSLV